jgi:hypothetical protein
MLVFVAIFFHSFGQVIWQEAVDPVHDLVAQMARNKLETIGKSRRTSPSTQTIWAARLFPDTGWSEKCPYHMLQ